MSRIIINASEFPPRKFRCSYCNRTFSRRSWFKKHSCISKRAIKQEDKVRQVIAQAIVAGVEVDYTDYHMGRDPGNGPQWENNQDET